MHIDVPAVIVKQRIAQELYVIHVSKEIKERITGRGNQEFVAGIAEQAKNERVSFTGAGSEEQIIDKPGDYAQLSWRVRAGDAGVYTLEALTNGGVEKYQVAKEGGWYATRRADGSPQSDTRSSMWQGAYHSGRAMILCAKLLEEVAGKGAGR